MALPLSEQIISPTSLHFLIYKMEIIISILTQDFSEEHIISLYVIEFGKLLNTLPTLFVIIIMIYYWNFIFPSILKAFRIISNVLGFFLLS